MNILNTYSKLTQKFDNYNGVTTSALYKNTTPSGDSSSSGAYSVLTYDIDGDGRLDIYISVLKCVKEKSSKGYSRGNEDYWCLYVNVRSRGAGINTKLPIDYFTGHVVLYGEPD